MTKAELIEMLQNVPDHANIKIAFSQNRLFAREIVYHNVEGYYNLTDMDIVITDVAVVPRVKKNEHHEVPSI